MTLKILDLLPNQCSRCLSHFLSTPMIVEAFASVGIEHGKSSGQMAQEFYAQYHANKHGELPKKARKGDDRTL